MTHTCTTQTRVERINAIVCDGPLGTEDEMLADLLADAMHWCDAYRRDFFINDARASRHYLAEIGGER